METKMTARTTTTDLGKIVLMPGGEYSPDKTYEERTFVLYQNSTYVALQTVTGIEPSNDLVNWQLMAKGFAGSETQIEGYVFVDNEEVIAPAADPALDADKLGGNLPDYYAPQHEISDAYSDAKSYVAGDYCIYLNALYRFTKDKEAGAWDGSSVVPVTLSSEIQGAKEEIERINGNFIGTNIKSYISINDKEEMEQQVARYIGTPGFYFLSTSEPKGHPEINYSSGFFLCRTNTYTIVVFAYDRGSIHIQSGYKDTNGHHWTGWKKLNGI